MGAMMMVTQTANIAFAATFTCADFNSPAPGATDKTAGYIITVIEEAIGTPSTTDVGTAYNCFRETTTTVETGTDAATGASTSKTKENSEFKDSCTPSDTVTCKRVQIFVAQSGAELLYSYLGRIYKWAAGTIGIVAVLYLVWGGVEMSTAQGDQGKYEKAKERITQSLAGLVILFLSALILYTINPNFFTIS